MNLACGSAPGALNLPDGGLIVYCQVGQRGHVATTLLAGTGRRVANLDGGYLTWLAGQG